jgi:hypothetical protein
MRTNILFFLLGIFITISIAAATSNLMMVQPAIPVSTILKNCGTLNVTEFVESKTQEGYIVKQMIYTENNRIWVLMEKY